MVNKHKQRKKRPFKNYGKSNKELNALIEKKIPEICEKQEEEEIRERITTLSTNANLR